MSSTNETAHPSPELQMAEKEEELKLKSKYPQMQRPGPQFLQKRLQKGQKFFDSGDYNMAKAAAAKGTTGKSRLSESILNQNPPLPPVSPAVVLPQCTSPTSPSEVIPTISARKPSIHVPSKLVSGGP